MIFKVSTTGTPTSVVLEDMGQRTLDHPTVALDLGLEYTDDELIDSGDLAYALEQGWLILIEKSGGTVTTEELDTAVSGTVDYIDDEISNIEAYVDATTSGSFASVLVTKNINLSLPTEFIDVPWEITDVETDPTVIEHSTVGTDNIIIHQEGLYLITYSLSIDAAATESTFDIHVRKNDTTVIPGSLRTISEDDEINDVSNVFTVILESNDFITLQARSSDTGDLLETSSNMMVTKLGASKGEKGVDGDQGPPGEDGVLTVSGTADYFNGYDSTGTTQLNTSYTDIPLTQGYTTSAFSHSGAEVTINQDNTYIIIGRFTVAQPSTSSRSEAQMRLVVDTGGGYTEIPGTIGVCYSRISAQGKSTASAQVVLDLNDGDKVKLQAKENSGGTLFGDQNGSGVMVFTTAGQTGPQGVKGDQGDSGDDGVDGIDGQDGIDAGGTLAVVQARRTTAYTLTTTYANVTFDATDEEVDSAQIEHNNSNTDRIDIKDGGTFLVAYDFSIDASDAIAEVTYIEAQVLSDDTTVLDGSWSRTTTFNESSLDGNPLFYNHLSNSFLVTLNTNDYLSLQLKYTGDGADTTVNGTFKVIKLVGARGADGADGPTGTPGSGSTINLQDEGSSITNTPHSNLNFTGAGVTASDAGSGVATISIPGGSDGVTIQEEGSDLANTPHSTINFIGSAVTATDNSGAADITITAGTPIFGSDYDFDSAEGETNTNSTSQVAKLTFNVTGLAGGDYRVNWYYEWRRNTASNDYRADVEVNGTLIMEHREESKDVNSWHTNAGFDNVTLTSGNHTIVLYHYGDSTGSTSYTRRARLEIWRVS